MKVLRVLTRANVGGPARQATALWHAHRELGVATLLAVGDVRDDETAVDLAAAGIPEVAAGAVDRDSAGFVRVPALTNTFGGVRAARRDLRGLVERFAPDVVHTHTSKAGLVGRLAGQGSGAALVHTFHGHVLRDYFGPLRSFVLRRLERRLARCTDLLIAVSASCADELAELGVAPRDRFVVIPPAVALPPPVDRATARARLGLGADEFAVATVGRLVPIKRTELFLAAVAAVPDCIGHVYGGGPLRAELERAAPAGVAFLGTVLDVPSRLSAYDALVLPGRREGLPLAAVEAFAARVPVVGFDVPGVRDAVHRGGGVLVAEREGAAGLARALLALRDDASLRLRCVESGARAVSGFSPASVARELVGGYRRTRAERLHRAATGSS